MINLNDSIYDYHNYSIYNDRSHSEFIVDDIQIEKLLIGYDEFEKLLINDIINHKKSIYLRFCDGEFGYYRKGFDIIKLLQKLLGRDKTCRGEKADSSLVKEHFKVFEKNKNNIHFFPHVSNSYKDMFKKSLLRQYIQKNNIQFGHFYYIYHFLNKLRQSKINELVGIKIGYITHHKYIENFDHFKISQSYNIESQEYLQKTNFAGYDLLLLGGGIASPLYADAIAKTAACPVVDAGYILSHWSLDSIGDRVFTFIF